MRADMASWRRESSCPHQVSDVADTQMPSHTMMAAPRTALLLLALLVPTRCFHHRLAASAVASTCRRCAAATCCDGDDRANDLNWLHTKLQLALDAEAPFWRN